MKGILFSLLMLFLGASVKGQAPVITEDPKGITVCAGIDATFSVTTSINPSKYVWQLFGYPAITIDENDTGYSGVTSSILTVHTNTDPNNDFRYFRCIVSNDQGSDTSNWALLNVHIQKPLRLINTNTSVCAGAQGILYGQPMDMYSGGLYTWSYSGSGVTIVPISGDSLVALNFSTTATSGTLSVISTDACSTTAPATLAITVNPQQTTIAGTPGDGTHCVIYRADFRSSIGITYSDPSTCGPISLIASSGNRPVYGNIQSCVTVDASVQSYNSIPYVQRHYDIEPVNYPTVSTATVTLYFTQGDFDAYNVARGSNPALPTGPLDAAGIANLHVMQFHGTGTTPDTYVGGSGDIDPADSNIVWNSTASRWEVTFDITGFSGFFVSGASLVPLPLTLGDFSGQTTEQGNLLRWSTSMEENTDYFEIQRKGDGGDFVALARVAADGNSHETLQYNYIDNARPGACSYRLKMVDIDGKFTYSKTVVLGSSGDALSIRVLPNPARQPLSLTVGSQAAATAVLTVTDISGNKMITKSIILQKGANSLDAGILAGLPQGIYLIGVTTGEQRQIIKFVKE